MFNEVVTDYLGLQRHYINRSGFIFTSLTEPSNVFDAIVIKNPIDCKCFSPHLGSSKLSLNEHIDFINKYKLEKAVIIADNISFIDKCPTLKHIQIIPADNASKNFDFSPIYLMPEVKSLTCSSFYGNSLCLDSCIDYSKIKGIEEINIEGKRHDNFNKIKTIKHLAVSNFEGNNKDITDFSNSRILEELTIIESGVRSLKGIEELKNLSSLSLWYNRNLCNLSNILYVSDSLKQLSIDHCAKIKDFSFLSALSELEYLELLGNNSIGSLDFLENMKKLKIFTFNINVIDGDLTPCLKIPSVYCEKNRSHYNLKDNALPKTVDF